MPRFRTIAPFLPLLIFFAFAKSAAAITVGPAKLEYHADPGSVLTGTLFILNEGREEQTLYASFEKFTEVNGEKRFMPGEPTELTNWIKIPESVFLGAGEQKNIPFTVEVPRNAPPGGHFAVMWWGTAPPRAGQVSVVTRAGILVYLNVSGEVFENGELLSFRPSPGKVGAKLPDFVVRFRNNGNTYLKPQGEIAVKNMWGGTAALFRVNDASRILLPQGEDNLRLSPQFSKPPFMLGLYRAELNLAWGDKPETLTRSVYIWVLPWLHISGGLAALALLYFGLKFGIRRYNRRIIAKHLAAQKKEE